MIVGTGNVGASIGFALVNQRTAVDELILADINAGDAEGEAMDLSDAIAVAPEYLPVRAGTYADAGDCDVVVITAGVPQKPDGETRMQLLQRNAAVLKTIVEPIMASGFSGIFLVVSNPVDIMSYLTWRYSGLPAEQVIGSGLVLDSARLRLRLAERLGVNPKSIHAFQIGEHGDSELTLWSAASVGGQPIDSLLPQHAMDEIEAAVAHKAYEIIQRKGATYYGVAACVAKILNCILDDEKRVLPVSCYDDFTETYNGFPAVVGRDGVVRRLGINLSESEAIKFQRSVNVLREAIAMVE